MDSKKLDKFYTKPNISKKFVSKINELFPLNEYDSIIEPAAGNGSIFFNLPKNSIGFDIHPENDKIICQDFFKYNSLYDPLFNNIKVATITNPPFGKGYMNPLAKRFFNHAAKFSILIGFIVPAKWHTSWKVQFQLNKDFGLYYSELLPKNSFILDGNEYNVNCCMQIWSKTNPNNYKNLRILKRPPTSHSDFDLFLTCDNVPNLPIVREQIRNKEYWDFALKYWGKIYVCDLKDVPENTTTHYLFKAKKPYVRKIIESINWNKYITNMGAPNLGGKSILIQAYSDRKKEIEQNHF